MSGGLSYWDMGPSRTSWGSPQTGLAMPEAPSTRIQSPAQQGSQDPRNATTQFWPEVIAWGAQQASKPEQITANGQPVDPADVSKNCPECDKVSFAKRAPCIAACIRRLQIASLPAPGNVATGTSPVNAGTLPIFPPTIGGIGSPGISPDTSATPQSGSSMPLIYLAAVVFVAYMIFHH